MSLIREKPENCVIIFNGKTTYWNLLKTKLQEVLNHYFALNQKNID